MKPKVRKIYPKVLTLLAIPFILSGCARNVECNVPERHVHKYVGSNNKGTVTNYFDSEGEYIRVGYTDGDFQTFYYYRKDDYIDISKDDERFYEIKGYYLFDGRENWDYLYNVMATKKDFLEYQYQYDDGLGGWNRSWTTNKKKNNLTGKVRVCHYQFCGHKLEYKDGRWINTRSPFVDDIRQIIDEYPYFELDCYKVAKKEYTFDKKQVKDIKIEDINEFNHPDLENKDLYTNSK